MRKLISHISQPTNIPPDTKFLSSAFFVDRPITKCMQVAAIITPICVRLSELVQQQIYMRCTERKTTPRAAILELGRMNQQRYHTKLLFTRGRPVYKMSFFSDSHKRFSFRKSAYFFANKKLYNKETEST